MKVYVICAYSYDPEDIQGVFTSREKALAYLNRTGWIPCPDPYQTPDGCGCCPNDGNHFHAGDNWLQATIEEHVVQ